jgi:protein-disulfide isomerase
MTKHRRAFLESAVGTVLGLGLAGCLGGQSGDGQPTTTGVETAADTRTTSGETRTPTATETTATKTTATASKIDHPSAVGVVDEPTLGPKPWEAEAALILFSDPSCPYCQDFHEKTYPKLKKNLVDSGTVSYVYRTYPKVDPWGETAIYALESVYRRNEEVFWKLRDHYYENPGKSVLTEQTTRTFLKENSDLDVNGVIEDMNQQTNSESVEEDVHAARQADMMTIPSYAIVTNGEVRTTAHGVSSYQNIKTMLGV